MPKRASSRARAGFELPGERPPRSTQTEICENGVYYHVDFENGQKTGFFLDQKYNRRAVARLAAGHTVLDCFTHTGSFALNAASGGARPGHGSGHQRRRHRHGPAQCCAQRP